MPPRSEPGLYGPNDFSEILKESESLGVLVGGMAVNVWAHYYQKAIPQLREFRPFLTHDIDYVGGQSQALEVQQRIGWKIQTYKPGEAGSPTCAILTSKDGRLAEILHAVLGLNRQELDRLSTRLIYGAYPIIILSPPALLKAKLSNLDKLEQEKTKRQDLKQSRMLVPITKEFLKEAIEASNKEEIPAKQAVFYLNTVFEVINDQIAQPYLELFGEGGEHIFPIDELRNSTAKPFQNFYLHRISQN